jgi:two-component system response regulator
MNLPTILMIDASAEAIELARFTLWRNKIECAFRGCDSAETAMRSLVNGRRRSDTQDMPSMILIDPHLPMMDGLELVRMLRLNPATATVPIIVFSSSSEASDRQRAEVAGASAYVVKPVDAADYAGTLVRTIRDWLAHSTAMAAASMPAAA